jgi:hypothetical protein
VDILWRLVLGHLLADFTFQTNFINRWKREAMKGLFAHVGMHPLFYIPLCWPFLGEYWVDHGWLRLTGWACIAVVAVSHFFEDWWRIYAIKRYGMPDNTAFFFWDQVIHYAFIFLLAPIAARAAAAPGFFPEKWPVLGCLAVLATHACTVLIYFVEKDLYGADFPGDDEKYLAMAERLVLMLCFLFPSKGGALALAAAWLGVMFFLRRHRLFDLSGFTFYVGTAIACLCGIAARAVYYS